MQLHTIPNGHVTEDSESVEIRLERIEKGVNALLRGQADLTVAFGQIHRRVKRLEKDARWKVWIVNVAKAALPFVGGVVASRWPALADIVSKIVDAGFAP